MSHRITPSMPQLCSRAETEQDRNTTLRVNQSRSDQGFKKVFIQTCISVDMNCVWKPHKGYAEVNWPHNSPYMGYVSWIDLTTAREVHVWSREASLICGDIQVWSPCVPNIEEGRRWHERRGHGVHRVSPTIVLCTKKNNTTSQVENKCTLRKVLKGSVGLILVKTSTMRISIPLTVSSIYTVIHTTPSIPSFSSILPTSYLVSKVREYRLVDDRPTVVWRWVVRLENTTFYHCWYPGWVGVYSSGKYEIVCVF